jgi:DNA-binding NarL/FixJ family response regulator
VPGLKELKDVKKIRILVVEDHPVTRIGIAAIIEATPEMTAVAQAGSGEEAVALYEEFLPDITLMDLRLPGMSGVETIRAKPNSWSSPRTTAMRISIRHSRQERAATS